MTANATWTRQPSLTWNTRLQSQGFPLKWVQPLVLNFDLRSAICLFALQHTSEVLSDTTEDPSNKFSTFNLEWNWSCCGMRDHGLESTQSGCLPNPIHPSLPPGKKSGTKISQSAQWSKRWRKRKRGKSEYGMPFWAEPMQPQLPPKTKQRQTTHCALHCVFVADNLLWGKFLGTLAVARPRVKVSPSAEAWEGVAALGKFLALLAIIAESQRHNVRSNTV